MFESSATVRRLGEGCVEVQLEQWLARLDAECADQVAAVAAHAPTGVELSRLVASVDPVGLSEDGQVDYLVAIERLGRWVDALRLAALAAYVAPEREDDEQDAGSADLAERSRVADVALTLDWSENHTRNQTCLAVNVGNPARLGDAERLLREGVVSLGHLRILDDLTATLDDTQALQVSRRVLARAQGKTPAEFRQICRRAVTAIEPDAIVARHHREVRRRGVQWWPEPDGMATLQLYAPAPDVQAVVGALTILAGDSTPDDPRTIDARRCDALRDLCLDTVMAHDGPAPGHRPVATEAQIVIDLPTLLGLADHPAQLRGYGPIPAGLARDWLTETQTWRRLVTDPVTGHLIDYGPVVRFAPDKLRAFLAARDGSCTFPGCTRRADVARTQMDHHPPWQPDGAGGSTSAAQMASLCKHHHRLRTHGAWQITDRHDGNTHWRSPTGREYVTSPSGPLG